jgi:heat shock protein beta
MGVVFSYYATQKKTLELNPRHPLVKKLLDKVETDKEDKTAADFAEIMFGTAVLRSGYALQDSAQFTSHIERMLRLSMDVPLDEAIEQEEEEPEESEEAEEEEEEVEADEVTEETTDETAGEETVESEADVTADGQSEEESARDEL